MGPSAEAKPTRSFQSRLNRVAEVRAPIEAAKPQVSAIPDWKENLRYPAGLVFAAIVGGLCVFISRYARFHLLGGSMVGDDPDFTMIIDAGLAALCSFVLFSAMGFTSRERYRIEHDRGGIFGDTPQKTAMLVGIFAMVGLMHNAVHALPGPFSKLFSPQWTNEITATSEPGTFYFRGNYFVLIADMGETAGASDVEAEEQGLPRVIRLQ